MRRMSDKNIYKKETEAEGYFTGDGDCALIAPMESPIVSGDEDNWLRWRDIDWEKKIYFGSIMPEEMRGLDAPLKGKKCKFKFVVTVEKVENEEAEE